MTISCLILLLFSLLSIIRIDELHESFQRDPGVSLGEDVDPERQQHPGLLRGEGAANTRGVGADQVGLELPVRKKNKLTIY